MQIERLRHSGSLVTSFQPIETLLVEKLATTLTHFLRALILTAAPLQCPACSISLPLSLCSIALQWGNRLLYKPFPSLFLERAASDCRKCRTSCFLAGALTTTCLRRWPIGWGWNWGKWSQRSSATRRHGKDFATAYTTLLVALFADSGTF